MNNQDRLTEELGRELHRRADHLYDAPLTFEDVRGRARAIRRHRRAIAAASVAAAVALAVVVPTLLGGIGADRSEVEPAPAPPVSAHTAVLHDGVVTLPDGSTVKVPLDNADVSQLGLLTDGRIIAATSKPFAVQVYSPDGALAHQYAVQSNAITMSADDNEVAWVADDYSVRVLATGDAEPTKLPGIPMPGEGIGSIDAVLDPQHLLVGDFNTTTGEITPDGFKDLGTSEPLRVTDVSPDGKTWAVHVDGPDPQFGCSGLYDPEQDRLVARNCDTSNLRFAPDGEHLLGFRGDNNMFDEVEVFDLDLHQTFFTGRSNALVFTRAAWADDRHIMTVQTRPSGQDWWLIRQATYVTDADPDVLAGPVAGRNPEQLSEFLLSE